MFAIAAAFAFLVSLILNIVGGHQKLITDFEMAGLICVALHLFFGVAAGVPWRRR